MTASRAKARESRSLEARTAEALNSEQFVVAPASSWTNPEPIAWQRLGELGAVLFAVRGGHGGNKALYGLSRTSRRQAVGWKSVSGGAWFEDGFSQPPYEPGLTSGGAGRGSQSRRGRFGPDPTGSGPGGSGGHRSEDRQPSMRRRWRSARWARSSPSMLLVRPCRRRGFSPATAVVTARWNYTSEACSSSRVRAQSGPWRR